MSIKTNTIKLCKQECPADLVTVFTDRAEVTRTIKTKVTEGSNEIIITELPLNVQRNSIRVCGGQGSATILEVSSSTAYKSVDEDPNKCSRDAQIEDLQVEKRAIEMEQARVEKERVWLEGFASTIRSPGSVGKEGAPAATLFNGAILEHIGNFLEFYQNGLARIDNKSEKLAKNLKDINAKIAVLSGSLNPPERQNQFTEVTVALSAKQGSEITMQMSYVITGAQWNASYDVRVASGDKAIELTYYGNITNNSNDDWLNTPVVLSTAKPSVGGAPPTLRTKFVNFHVPIERYASASRGFMNAAPKMAVQSQIYAPRSEAALDDSDERESRSSSIGVMTANASEGVTSSTFNIARKCDIFSDNKPHKVTVTIIKLEAVFTYETIPRLQAEAFLKASVKNTADGYPFLPGEMNIFMDGNFVSKSSMEHVNASEAFTMFLGSDSGVKIEHKCFGDFLRSAGMFQKSQTKKFKSKIIIKNNKKVTVNISAYDQLPKSTDASIKVKLTEPVIEDSNNKNNAVKLTEANNVCWTLTIPPGDTREIPFEYSIEWPSGKKIDL